MSIKPVPDIRLRPVNKAPVNASGDFVLYWMIAFRRTRYNFSLQKAVEWSLELNKPLVILEALRIGYHWASDRFHRFIVDGMADNARRLEKRTVLYYPYMESAPDEDKGLLAALAEKACLVVTDEFPSFFLPRMLKSAAKALPVRVVAVDSNGLLPMRAADRVYTTAYAFRRFLQKELPAHLGQGPSPDPLKGVKLPPPPALPKEITRRWPAASSRLLRGETKALAALAIDHGVYPVKIRGGQMAAEKVMKKFLKERLPVYSKDRNHPDMDGTSRLSPYLHFGHISVHEIFDRLMAKEEWALNHLSNKARGGRSGWWGVSESAEAFLDELITWREVGFNMCRQRPDYARYASLPDWARKTLTEHQKDRRRYIYSLEQFETAQTHDPLWNAAQTELIREGRIHNYLRMLWGKKILEWTRRPEHALEIMVELNNKYALDGRDPNSYSGIFWVLGRYDRAWGPERPIFGKIRYMSSENTARKVQLKDYLETYKPS